MLKFLSGLKSNSLKTRCDVQIMKKVITVEKAITVEILK